jgi:hypothetical protein
MAPIGIASRLREAFARHPIERLVERTREPIEELLDFRPFDHERRRQCQDIAHHRAHDQTLFLGEADGGRADAMLRLE